MLDQPRPLQALGSLFGRVMFGFEWIDELQTHQVDNPNFYGHGAAIGHAAVAQAAAIPRPGIEAIDIDEYRSGC